MGIIILLIVSFLVTCLCAPLVASVLVRIIDSFCPDDATSARYDAIDKELKRKGQ